MDNRSQLTQQLLTKEVIDEKQQLTFLSGFTHEQLTELENKYKKNRFALEEIIATHVYQFRFEQILNYGGISTNLLYMFFRGETSNAGIENVAKIVQEDAKVSDGVGYGLGVSLAVPGTLVFVFAASAKNEAALSILEYAHCDPLNVRLKKALQTASENKMQAFIESIKFIANQAVLTTTYATSAMSNIIPIMDYLNKLPAGGKWSIILLIQYLTFRFNSTYYNGSYYSGLKFWWNEENRPYLLGEIFRGNIAIPVEIFLQGIISAAGLRAFPNYYYAALAASGALGGWIPATIVATLAGIHALCVLYPTTYNHYMTAHEEINTILRKNIPWEKIDSLLKKEENFSCLDEKTREKRTQQLIDDMVKSERDKLSKEARGDKGYTAVFKEEPSTIFTVSLTTLIGGIFGYKLTATLAPLIGGPPTVVAALSTAFAATLIGGSFYKAEDNRVNNELILKKLKKTESKEEKKSTSKNRYEKVAEIAATFFAVTNAASTITSTSGSGKLIGGDSPQMNLGITSLAIKGGLNNIVYNIPKVKSTLLSFAPTKQKDNQSHEMKDIVILENYFSTPEVCVNMRVK